MNFNEMRATVGSVAVAIDPASPLSDEQQAVLLQDAVKVVGLCLIGLYEELAGIRLALEGLENR